MLVELPLYSIKIMMAATKAVATTICDVSSATPGTISEGIATSNTIKNARVKAPVSRANTAISLQTGPARCIASPVSQLDVACDGDMPQLCPNLAFFPQTPQDSVETNSIFTAI